MMKVIDLIIINTTGDVETFHAESIIALVGSLPVVAEESKGNVQIENRQ